MRKKLCRPASSGTNSLRRARAGGSVALIVIVLGLFLFSSVTQAQTTRPSREYQIKASLIFNFLQFVQWPPEVWQNSDSTLKICVAGPNRFGVALTVLEREIVEGKNIAIANFSSDTAIDSDKCHVLFISKELSSQQIDQILSTVSEKSILTIGETPDFINKGGIISLLIDDDKIVFDINRHAVLKARLVVSSKLLRIARNTVG